jgi:hypothetical protein
MIPISLFESGAGPGPSIADWLTILERDFPWPFGRHLLRETLRKFKQREESLIVTALDEATEMAERNILSFLSYRFAGIKLWSGWMQEFHDLFSRHPSGAVSSEAGPSGGLQVQVSCSTPGLRIHVSPAIFRDWVVFGSPTTPVTNYILPGRYIFAGDGPMLPKRVTDNGVFKIPPTYQPTLTRF